MRELTGSDGSIGGSQSSAGAFRQSGENGGETADAPITASEFPRITCCDSAKAWALVEDAAERALGGSRLFDWLLPLHIEHALRVDAQS